MAKYVVFAEDTNSRGTGRIISGGRRIDRILGYLDSLADQGIIDGRFVTAEILEELETDLYLSFCEDTEIKRVLEQMRLPKTETYLIIRAKLLNEPELRGPAINLSIRYGLQHRVYEAELPEDEQ